MARKTTRQQTTRINGVKVRLVTGTNGKITITPSPVEEWLLQAAAVRALRAMPDYGKLFTIAGDFNAARRSMREQVKAKATGLTPGEHDLRIYMAGGKLGLIEFKNAEGRLAKDQIARHTLLHALGFGLQSVVKVGSEEEAAAASVDVVSGWLALAVAA